MLSKLKQEIPSWFEQMYKNGDYGHSHQKFNKYKSQNQGYSHNNKYNKIEAESTNNYYNNNQNNFSNNNFINNNGYQNTKHNDDLQPPKFFNRNKDNNNYEPKENDNPKVYNNFNSGNNNNPSNNNNFSNVIDYKSNMNKFSKIPEVTFEKFPRANYNKDNK